MILPITFIIEGMSYPSIHLYHYVGGGLPTFQLFFSPLAVASPRPAQLPPFCRRWHRPMQLKRKRSNGALTPCGRRRNFLRPAQGPSEREGSVGNILKIRKNSGAAFWDLQVSFKRGGGWGGMWGEQFEIWDTMYLFNVFSLPCAWGSFGGYGLITWSLLKHEGSAN